MSVLPYCILLRDLASSIPETGVLNSRIHRMCEGDLLALYSELLRGDIRPEKFQPAGLEFHRVVHAIFDEAAVVPFRFPTWLTAQELGKHLQHESQRYTAFLTRHATDVQMEIRLRTNRSSPTKAASGTAHLRARAVESRELRDMAEDLKTLLSSEAIEWRERETSDGLRIYALVGRADIPGFRERLGKRTRNLSMRWSGPWPATEFLESGGDLNPERRA